VGLMCGYRLKMSYGQKTRRYLSERFGAAKVHCNVVTYAGDTENTVKEGTHDWCIEVVYRGDKSTASAMSETGLKVAEIVRFSDISLIGRLETRVDAGLGGLATYPAGRACGVGPSCAWASSSLVCCP